jgi:hypothetical protein
MISEDGVTVTCLAQTGRRTAQPRGASPSASSSPAACTGTSPVVRLFRKEDGTA